MAIFHFTARVISTAEGRDGVVAAAYRHVAQMERTADGRGVNFQGKGDVEHEEMALPPGAPA